MKTLDALTLAGLVVQLGLVTKAQLKECWDEKKPSEDPEPLLRELERKGYLTPYQSQKLLKGDTEGYFIGDYRLLYKVASGSFGRVFRADNPRTGAVVAVKLLRQRWNDDPHSIELFEREAKVGLSLKHPNIVSMLAVDKDQATKQYYMVMEFVEGGNLKELLAIRKKLPPAEALRLIEDAATGLAHSYSKGISHRDIKLTNILISSQGAAKLVDFGLAGSFTPGSKEDEEQVERTVDYAGLEKATGVPQGDVRSDIYFLGCVLYEMLTGWPPLSPTVDPHERMQKQRFARVRPMDPKKVEAPAAVFQLVETMMALDPQKRYQTPAMLLERIREARRSLEKQSQPESSRERTLFIVEADERLKNVFREKFKKLGFRVLIASNPDMAFIRFKQQPFDALIIDAGTAGEEGVNLFRRILTDAQVKNHPCAGVLLLSENQAHWAGQVQSLSKGAAVIRPLNLRDVVKKLNEMLAKE